ncbi:integral membrane protein [Rhizodiscina lignyota]|uniref:Integral membrane protein n=1 Tax=Rhizodiscina lignyota TaxID=1504668 RepID=A0A9P4MDL9_9PEZI|nr:integral membrane protein [Rhizodiscina lignyota]
MSSTSTSTTEIELQSVPVAYHPALTTSVDSAVPASVPLDRLESESRSREAGQRAPLTRDEDIEHPNLGKGKTLVVIVSVTCITAISSLLSGLVTVALPTIARDLGLSESLLLWPASIYALTCGCTLLLLGSIADVVGSRHMYLLGCALQSAFTLACGLSQNGPQLILFRALAGIAISFCLPSAVSIITNSFAPGKRRNVAFAAMGGGQPIGFTIGLTLGGVFADTIGWRWGFYTAAIMNTIILVVAIWGLPKTIGENDPITWKRLGSDIDWVGAILASSALAMLSYVFAILTGNTASIRDSSTITILAISIALIPAFIYWCGRQERLGRPAIIPNSLWRNKVFTCICINVFVVWGAFNALELLLTLYFQDVQKMSAINTSVHFLPSPAAGATVNIMMALIVHRVRADVAIIISLVVSAISPLIMAFAMPSWSFWAGPFPALFLNPVGSDVLFTISNLVITSVFPARTQALAGGVFNTVSQIGKSVGLATAAVVAASVTARSEYENKRSPEALLEGYHASFWYLFALTLAALGVSLWGLRKIGKVGLKQD